MKLIDALEILRQPVPEAAPHVKVALACGFTPLHLETLLAAELRQLLPSSRIQIATGLYDDLAGSLRRFREEACDTVAVVVEWPDIDPRLGLRRLGGWRVGDLEDIVRSSSERLSILRDGLMGVVAERRVVCCLPTLPLPPLFPPRREESGAHELQLRGMVASFASELASHPSFRTVGAQALDHRSPLPVRRDVRSELETGFPYSLGHASAVAEALAVLIRDPAPKKGLITDLDDTLWAGLVGEMGADRVTWTLDGHSQAHGLYQQLLASLASTGVLIGAASKNEPAVVDEVLARRDLLMPREAMFPVEVSWDRKSRSVQQILRVWNIAPEDVVFVDDSPMELAEVQDAFPAMEVLLFPENEGGIWSLLGRLRDLFGKRTLTAEDSLRMESIRSATRLREVAAGSARSLGEFLQAVDGKIEFSLARERDQRSLDLINKTNQFNLNGRRLSEAALDELLTRSSSYLLTVAYEDKFGPLGKIAALVGHTAADELVIDIWVMSCRAFSRQIEHQTLAFLFTKFEAEAIELSYEVTERNRPLQEFLGSLVGSTLTDAGVRVTREEFIENVPSLVHTISEAVG